MVWSNPMRQCWKHKIETSRQLVLGLALALLSVVVLAPAAYAGILDLTWTAPTTNADGTALTDLASYRVYYGTSTVTCPGGSTFVTVPSATASPPPGTTVNYRLTGLQTGTTYYVGVTAVDTSGNESSCSNAASGVARSGATVQADFDGDRKTDIAVYRGSTGQWFILRSSDGSNTVRQWGDPTLGDIPVVGDFDGDGKADRAVYRGSTGQWFILRSSDGSYTVRQWGDPQFADIPVH